MLNKNAQSNGLAILAIEKAWAGTCKAVLGGGLPPMRELEAYLSRHAEACHVEKSSISGKPLVAFGNYPPGTKFMRGAEILEYEALMRNSKLGINDIKDIDSAIRAVSEIGIYAGDIVLGNSGNVVDSTRVVDSTNIFRSSDVIYSKNVAYTRIAKYCESVFGCASAGKGTMFAIGCNEMYMSNRTFECFYIYSSSDVCYSANIENCQDCLFSFNQRGKRRLIGNRELSADKYAQLKSKLLSEAKDMLSSRKSVPSIYEIIRGD